MKGTPFRPVIPFGKELLSLSLKPPSLQSLPRLSESGLMHTPFYTISPISTDPLPIEIDVYIDIEASLDVDCHIRSRYGLTKGRCRCNGRKEGNEDFEVVGGSGDQVGQVGG